MTNKNSARKILLGVVALDQTHKWGEIANLIQDLYAEWCEENHKEAEWNLIYDKMQADVDACKDQDGALINGDYYDWRVFDSQKVQIIESFLKYFTDEQCEIILTRMKENAQKIRNKIK